MTCAWMITAGLLVAANPELVVQAGHSVSAMSTTAAGRIATGSDNDIKIWDVRTGRLFRTIADHDSPVVAVALTPDGKSVISSTMGSQLVQAKISVYDVQSGLRRHELRRAQTPLTQLWTSKDGRLLVAGGDAAALLFDLRAGQELGAFGGYAGGILYVDLDAKGRHALVVGRAVARLWTVANMGIKHTFRSNDAFSMASLALGDALIVLADGRGAFAYDVKSGAQKRTLYVGPVLGGTVDGTTAVLDIEGATVHVDLRSGKELRRVAATSAPSSTPRVPLEAYRGATEPVKALALSPDGNQLVTSSGHVWDLTLAKVTRRLPVRCSMLEYLPDGGLACLQKGTLAVLDVGRGEVTRSFTVGAGPGAVSPNGKYVASGEKGVIELFDMTSGKRLRSFEKNGRDILALTFLHDGKTLLSGDGDTTLFTDQLARYWDVDTGKAQGAWIGKHRYQVWAVAASPTGNFTASASWSTEIQLHGLAQPGMHLLEGHTNKVSALGFSADGRYLASGGYDGRVVLWDLASKKPAFEGLHEGSVTVVRFSRDGRWLVTGSEDGAVRLFDVERRSSLATLVAVGDEAYVAATADGYYRASKDALGTVGFRLGARVFGFEQFDLKLNRPDHVVAALGRAPRELVSVYRAAFAKRLNKLGVNEKALRIADELPEVVIEAVGQPGDDGRLRLRVTATDAGGALDRLHVSVNGVPIYGALGMSLEHKRKVVRDIDIELSHGANEVQAVVANTSGVESLRDSMSVRREGEVQPTLYAVLIGVSKYQQSDYDLMYAAKDARDLAGLLQKPGGRFGRVVVSEILDGEATKERIAEAKQFLMQSKVDDHALVFVAGHGLLDDNLDYFFATTDLDFENPRARGVSYESLEHLLDGIPARNKLLLMDTCHAGEIDRDEVQAAASTTVTSVGGGEIKRRAVGTRGLARKRTSLPPGYDINDILSELFADLRRGSGAVVIASSGGAEFAQESSRYKNGVFTYSILDGLSSGSADANKDGTVRISELRDHVARVVPKLTLGQQRPTMRRERVQFDFVFR